MSLDSIGVDAIDYANFVSKTKTWDNKRINALRDLLNINEYPGSKWLVTQIKESLTKEDSVVVEVIPSSCLPKTPPIKIHIFSQTNQAMKSLFENLFEFEHPDSVGVSCTCYSLNCLRFAIA